MNRCLHQCQCSTIKMFPSNHLIGHYFNLSKHVSWNYQLPIFSNNHLLQFDNQPTSWITKHLILINQRSFRHSNCQHDPREIVGEEELDISGKPSDVNRISSKPMRTSFCEKRIVFPWTCVQTCLTYRTKLVFRILFHIEMETEKASSGRRPMSIKKSTRTSTTL